jgi:hypothetical protein
MTSPGSASLQGPCDSLICLFVRKSNFQLPQDKTLMSSEDCALGRQISVPARERAKLLDDMTALFAQSPYVSHVFVTAEDDDSNFNPHLLVAFGIEVFDSAVGAFENLLAQTISLVFPGLIVKSEDGCDGIGFVFLISAGGKLIQLEISLITSEQVPLLPRLRHARLLFTRPVNASAPPLSERKTSAQIADTIGQTFGMEEAFIAVFHAGMTVRSAIARRDSFLNYETTHGLNIALRNLMRTALDSQRVSSGWSGFANVLSSNEHGLKHAPAFKSMISGSAVHTETTLLSAIRLAIDFMKDVDGAIPERFDEPISYYLKCMGSS